ncbi:MAG: response regulator transcription factor [Phycisphaeraceae bacterium]|nr:response regulator transcription factor [Phycisphaeraceae bacterium]
MTDTEQSAETKTKILLVDDHIIVRDSLARRLEDEPDLEVPHTAGDADEGLALAEANGFDVIVMDINMPGMSCFEAAKRLQTSHPDLPLVFLSAYWNDAFIEQAQGVGAVGLLSKSDEPDLLINAIRTVVDGGVFLSDEVRGRFESETAADNPDESKTKLSTLTPREVDVLRWVGMGQSRKQMAAQLGISENTVAVHTNRIMRKLDIHDRVGLARFSIKIGLSPLDEPS